MQRNGDRFDKNDLDPDLVSELPQLALIGGFRKYST
jgi:hypothetical protein